MRIRGMGIARQAARWIRNGSSSRVLILLYHRVSDLSSPDPFFLNVTAHHFAEHLEVLREHGPLMQLEELTQALRCGKLPRRAVAITFDDGYANNLHNAKPLLDRYDMPATVFVTIGHIGRQREFWWDELERLVLNPGTLPETLRLTVNGSPREWQLGDAAYYGQDEYLRYCNWHVSQDEAGPRQRLYRALYQLLRTLPDTERRHLLEELVTWAGAEQMPRQAHRPLSVEEVVQLAEDGLVEIGAHTVTHPSLGELPAAAQRTEILDSKIRLQEILGRPVMSFAYPFGDRRHYTPETAALVQESGFGSACTTSSGLVLRGADCFQLPRMTVRDSDGDAFGSRLREWFRG